ncbi:serine hydrolase [Polynucleobacter sp. Nonnen-W13]|jgi:serine-type D-Ala-D-Ala endopeptidase (penicillin-binding protein 7)|uniref:serine hydrolase n=1 Tax=Polynucleobacter sp. Nonnen-W13 TaxID=1855625 RepID=UPI001BFDDAF8|nr:serine hydrolase [Polynucleobacter sp. Nonnen-W13]MBU3559135.1 serine hydrolase [Polynucleobacter sp. Nonnen-W13]MCF8189654.1 serine hydrolase [Polynucleobacter sp.]QWE29825.1 serine hydrolase [Polynucleobacter sp. Adler-ghost]
MYLNRFWLVALVCLISFGAASSSPVMANNSDSKTAKSTKAAGKAPAKSESKKVVKSTKKPKTVRTTVTRPGESVVPARPSFATALGLRGQHDDLSLQSSVAMVVNQDTKEVYFEKNSSVSLPIASITKLMTAMVVLDSKLPLDETMVINADDVNIYRSSRLAGGTVLTREEALLLSLMSSENRAAYTLGRNYPGGISAFIDAMNRKAKEIGMTHSYFADPTGLRSENVASAEDLARMLSAAYQYKMIRDFSTWPDLTMVIAKRPQKFLNTNRLVRSGDMNIGLQKTGFINAAGKCLVMQARINNTPLLLVFLDSVGTQSRFADAVRVRDWYERMPLGEPQAIRRLM